MDISYAKLRDKILGCWNGKNVGGVLGGPYEECPRMVHDVHFYAQDINGNPPGNDDLDLQLVWLKALSEVGPNKLDAKALGEYWLTYVGPPWNEYGIGKANMQMGIVPPMSGELNNADWKHSNGAWIRTEVWAMDEITHDPENTFVKFYANNPFDTLLQIKDEVVAVNNNSTLPTVLDTMKTTVLQKAYETDESIESILKDCQATAEAEAG